MGPITYSLCQKPVIGFVMWAAYLCGFPPLIPSEPFPLTTAGITVAKEFKAPVDKAYAFELVFEFPSGAERLNDQLIGSWPLDYCGRNVRYEDIYKDIPESQRVKMGHPVPIRVVVLRLVDRSVVADQTYMTLCSSAFNSTMKWRTIGWVTLSRGKYIAEVTNLESQPAFAGIKTTFTLVSGHGK
jgi:hypothetical protein